MWNRMAVGSAAALLATGCFIDGERDGNGDVRTEPRAVGSFTRVANHSSLNVVVREAETAAVSVTIDSNLQEQVELNVEGDTLVIDIDGWDVDPSDDAVVEVSVPRLLGVEVDGSGELEVEPLTTTEELQVRVTGSGTVHYRGTPRSLTAVVTGSGSLRASTPTEELLEAVHLTVTGSGSLMYSGRARLVSANSEGTGDVHVEGAAQRLEASTQGSGDVDARNLTAVEGRLATQGSGDVLARVNSGTVSVSVAGSGNVELWGNASVQSSVQGSGRLIRH